MIENLIVIERVEQLGSDFFQAQLVVIDEAADELEVGLGVRAELVPGDLVDQLGVELVQAGQIFFDVGLGQVFQLVIVLGESVHRSGRWIEFPISVQERVDELGQLGILPVLLGQHGSGPQKHSSRDQDQDECFPHKSLLNPCKEILYPSASFNRRNPSTPVRRNAISRIKKIRPASSSGESRLISHYP
jgi:hypothetical protein